MTANDDRITWIVFLCVMLGISCVCMSMHIYFYCTDERPVELHQKEVEMMKQKNYEEIV